MAQLGVLSVSCVGTAALRKLPFRNRLLRFFHSFSLHSGPSQVHGLSLDLLLCRSAHAVAAHVSVRPL